MTAFESVQTNIALGWKLISCNTVSFILAAVTAACKSNLGIVNYLSSNGASLDLTNMNIVVTLLLLNLKQTAAPYANDDAFAKTLSSIVLVSLSWKPYQQGISIRSCCSHSCFHIIHVLFSVSGILSSHSIFSFQSCWMINFGSSRNVTSKPRRSNIEIM